MKTKKYIQLAVGTLVSVFFIWLAFWLGGVEFESIWEALFVTNWLYAVPFMAITMASFYWRAIRWKVLLDPVKQIPSQRLYGPLMVGFAFNNIIPARVGELARPIALLKQEKVPMGVGISTVVAERLIDVVTLLGFLIVVPMFIQFDDTVARTFALGDRQITIDARWIQDKLPGLSIFALLILFAILSFLIPQVKRLYEIILEKMPLIPGWVKDKLFGFMDAMVEGFSSLKDIKAIVLVVIHSVGIWMALAFSFQLMSWGFPNIEMNLGHGVAFLVVTCVIISVPSSPGYWGLYEFGGMVALLMMGVVPDTPAGASRAFTYTLVIHFLQWVPITVYGLWVAARLSVSAHDAEEAAENIEEEIPDHHGEEARES